MLCIYTRPYVYWVLLICVYLLLNVTSWSPLMPSFCFMSSQQNKTCNGALFHQGHFEAAYHCPYLRARHVWTSIYRRIVGHGVFFITCREYPTKGAEEPTSGSMSWLHWSFSNTAVPQNSQNMPKPSKAPAHPKLLKLKPLENRENYFPPPSGTNSRPSCRWFRERAWNLPYKPEHLLLFQSGQLFCRQYLKRCEGVLLFV